MIDINMGWTADQAIIAGGAFQEFDPYWIEEPVLPDYFSGYSAARKRWTTRVVGGETISAAPT